MTEPGDLKIDGARLQRSLTELATIGAYHDDDTGLTGVCRPALSDEDAEARRRVVRWFEEAGLVVSVDRIGNIYGRRAGRDDRAMPVLCGSHLDTVPTAGAFDGALGVLGALEVVRTLNDRGVATRRPLVVGIFTNEEGCRFHTDMLGSAVATGRIALEEAWRIEDADGVSIGAELERIGFLGELDPQAMRPHAYLECHVEQGPILARAGADVGVVTGVQAIAWYELTLSGQACHAGTTPMELRRDPAAAAARIVSRVQEMALSGDYGDAMRATVGTFRARPGAINVVPSRVEATVDLRNPADADMERAERELIAFLDDLAEDTGVKIEHQRTARTPAVAFDPAVQERIAASADSLGLSHRRILSGAGHDAQEWARIVKTAMVFVPGQHDGVSHTPRELSTPEQCAAGVNVLLHTLLALADEE